MPVEENLRPLSATFFPVSTNAHIAFLGSPEVGRGSKWFPFFSVMRKAVTSTRDQQSQPVPNCMFLALSTCLVSCAQDPWWFLSPCSPCTSSWASNVTWKLFEAAYLLWLKAALQSTCTAHVNISSIHREGRPGQGGVGCRGEAGDSCAKMHPPDTFIFLSLDRALLSGCFKTSQYLLRGKLWPPCPTHWGQMSIQILWTLHKKG